MSVVLGVVAAGVGLSLLGSGSRRPSEPARSDRVHPDELPSIEDFKAQLEALGFTPQGEPLALPEPARRLEVIDVPAEAAEGIEAPEGRSSPA